MAISRPARSDASGRGGFFKRHFAGLVGPARILPPSPPGFADQGDFRLPAGWQGRNAQADAPQAPRPAGGRVRDLIAAGHAGRLSDKQLLGMLLLLATPLSEDPRPLAAVLIDRFGSFAGVLAAPLRELAQVSGLGRHGLAAIKLTHAAALRLARASVAGRPVLDNWGTLVAYLQAALAREKVEQFRILFLGAGEVLLADEAQARGTVNHTPVYPREVVKRALELSARSLILVHNHPSGDPTPSREDLAMTEQVRQAAATLGVALQDHVIVGNGRWLSFRAEGLLETG